LQSIIATLPVNFENIKRIDDYSIFTIPRVLEGMFDLLEKLGYVKPVKGSLYILFAISMAGLLVMREHYSASMAKSYKGQLEFFFQKPKEEKEVKRDQSSTDIDTAV
jgi:hypothetical protein